MDVEQKIVTRTDASTVFALGKLSHLSVTAANCPASGPANGLAGKRVQTTKCARRVAWLGICCAVGAGRVWAPPGKLDFVKAKALQVPNKDLWRFKAGVSVMVEATGQLVAPQDVLEPLEPDFVFAVVDCPTAAMLPVGHATCCHVPPRATLHVVGLPIVGIFVWVGGCAIPECGPGCVPGGKFCVTSWHRLCHTPNRPVGCRN
jgi:hypothetical protein